MNPRLVRLLLWCGFLAGVVFFAGDMALLATTGSGRAYNQDRVFNLLSRVPIWRVYAAAIAAPVGVWLELLGMFGLALGCRPAAPRWALAMLVCLYTFDIFGLAPHSAYVPIGFALRSCGSDGEAVRYILLLTNLLSLVAFGFFALGMAIWILLTLVGRSGAPRWTVFFCPLVTHWLRYVLVSAPAPFGFALIAGWSGLASALFFAVVASVYRPAERRLTNG